MQATSTPAIVNPDEGQTVQQLSGLVADLNRCLKDAAQAGLTVRLAIEERKAQTESETNVPIVLIMSCVKKFI
jgi:hypothetical protein